MAKRNPQTATQDAKKSRLSANHVQLGEFLLLALDTNNAGGQT